MAIASHLGPWLLGTTKFTTGTTASTIRNMGASTVTQTDTITFGELNTSLTGNAFTLPAGSIIHAIQWYTTATFSAATTLKLSIGATDITAAVTITGPSAPLQFTAATASDTVTSLLANTGTTDKIVTYTATRGATLTTGSVTVQVLYTVRNADGSTDSTTA
jgi:hypothetical protein